MTNRRFAVTSRSAASLSPARARRASSRSSAASSIRGYFSTSKRYWSNESRARELTNICRDMTGSSRVNKLKRQRPSLTRAAASLPGERVRLRLSLEHPHQSVPQSRAVHNSPNIYEAYRRSNPLCAQCTRISPAQPPCRATLTSQLIHVHTVVIPAASTDADPRNRSPNGHSRRITEGRGGRCSGSAVQRPDLVQPIHRATQVRDHDRAADDQPDRERLEQLLVAQPLLDATHQVVGDAVVAAQDHGRNEAEQLLRAGVEGACLVGAAVEREEAADLEVPGLENPLVHALAEVAELLEIHDRALRSSASMRSGPGPSFRRKRVYVLALVSSTSTVSARIPRSVRSDVGGASSSRDGRRKP